MDAAGGGALGHPKIYINLVSRLSLQLGPELTHDCAGQARLALLMLGLPECITDAVCDLGAKACG